jgi:hypothetical protein
MVMVLVFMCNFSPTVSVEICIRILVAAVELA